MRALRGTTSESVLVTLGLLALVATLTPLGESTVAALGVRVVGVALVVVAAARTRAPRRGDVAWLGGLMASIALYVVVGTFFHGQWVDGIVTLASLVVVTSALLFALRRLDPAVFLTACRRVLTASVLVSLALGVLTPDTALEMGRLRGAFENANSTGFVALALGTLTLLRPRGAFSTVVTVGGVAAALAWSASRTSALALLIVVVIVLIARRSATLVLFAFVVAVGVLCLWAWQPEVQTVLDGLLRGTDSRSATTDLAVEVFRRRPEIGIGIGNEHGTHVSSPIMAFVHAGLAGAIAFAGMAAAFGLPAARGGWSSWTVTLALLVHSTGESWLLSPISPMLLVSLCVWRGVVGTDPVLRRRDPEPPVPDLAPSTALCLVPSAPSRSKVTS